MMVRAILVILLSVLVVHPVLAEKLPADMNRIDVTSAGYGAIADDGLSDAEAFRKAIHQYPGQGATVYVPCGDYTIDQTIHWTINSLPTPAADVSAAADTFTETKHGFVTNRKGTFTTTDTLPAPLAELTNYWAIQVDANTYKVAASSADALAGTAIDLTDAGIGIHTFVPETLWFARTSIEGEDRDCVTLTVPDDTAPFNDPNAPNLGRSVLHLGEGPESPQSLGSGNEGYENFVRDLTINVGSSNPGAIGINSHQHNTGSIRRVNIISADGQGDIGLYLNRQWQGPQLIEDVSVTGFDQCAKMSEWQYSSVFRNFTCTNQNTHGVDIFSNFGIFENFTSVQTTNGVPAIVSTSNSDHAQLTIIGGSLTGGSDTRGAIELGSQTKFVIRNLDTDGYLAALKLGTVFQGPTSYDEIISHTPISLFGAPVEGMKKTIEQPPAAYYSDPDVSPGEWRSVVADGAFQDGTNAAATQTAIETSMSTAGVKIVYFPRKTEGLYGGATPYRATYHVVSQMSVPETVERIILEGSRPQSDDPNGFLIVNTGDANSAPLLIEGPAVRPAGNGGITIDSARPVVLRDLQGSVTLTANAGKVWMLNQSAGPILASGGQIWVWQFNNESDLVTELSGINAWFLGFKTERNRTQATIDTGSHVEILGGWHQTPGGSSLGNWFEVTDAELSINSLTFNFVTGREIPVFVRAQKGSQIATVTDSDGVGGTTFNTRVHYPLINFYDGPKEVLFVSGSDTVSETLDVNTKTHLEGIGFTVTEVDDDDVVLADADGMDLIYISSSALGTTGVGSLFRSSGVAILNALMDINDDLEMSYGNLGTRLSGATSVRILETTHPIAAGLFGDIAIYSAGDLIAVDAPVEDGVNVAWGLDGTGVFRSAIFAFDTGFQMQGGFEAPARRVAFGLDYSATDLTASGWSLFEAAAKWASEPSAARSCTCE